MSKHKWNCEKSVLSYKGKKLKFGDAIPTDFPEKDLKGLISKKKVVKVVSESKKVEKPAKEKGK